MKRDFNAWLNTMTDSIASWTYYTDFPKIYENVGKIKVELSILNSLVGSVNIESEFKKLATEYPNVLSAIPILIAKREKEIIIKDAKKDYNFNFKNPNYSIEEYNMFMRKTGLFNLLEKHIISNLIDYVSGVEVGMDTNARKNRTGDAMEDLVESYIIDLGFEKNKSYFKEMYKSEVEEKFGLDLSHIKNDEETNAEKRFDFVIHKNGHTYCCECNFYSGGGSKLNETARSYKEITLETKDIEHFTFVWFTDGKGWFSAKNNLKETFDILDTIYNIQDLKSGVLNKLIL